MKLNIAYPVTGGQKILEISDEHRISQFIEKKMSQEVDGAVLGDDFKGYIFRISGGNDKQGFPMMQGVLTPNRVRLLLKKGDKCFRERRSGERIRKSVRGCIVSREICVLNLLVVKKGPKEIEGVTDVRKPRRVGPKRAGKIRKLFGLSKSADVRKYVVRHKVVNKKGKEKSKAPKIQRLTTKLRLKRKKYLEQKKIKSAIKTREGMAAYKKLLLGRQKIERQELLQAARLKKEKKLKKEEEKKTGGKKKATTAAATKSKAKTSATVTKAKAPASKGGKPVTTKDSTTAVKGKEKGPKAVSATPLTAAKVKTGKSGKKTTTTPPTAAGKAKTKVTATAVAAGKGKVPAKTTTKTTPATKASPANDAGKAAGAKKGKEAAPTKPAAAKTAPTKEKTTKKATTKAPAPAKK